MAPAGMLDANQSTIFFVLGTFSTGDTHFNTCVTANALKCLTFSGVSQVNLSVKIDAQPFALLTKKIDQVESRMWNNEL